MQAIYDGTHPDCPPCPACCGSGRALLEDSAIVTDVTPCGVCKGSGREGRAALVARLLRERPDCQVCLQIGEVILPACDVHEVLTRARGGSILDESNCMTVCRSHHDWIGNNQAEALARGWLKSGTRVAS
jgi:hypothetical protein